MSPRKRIHYLSSLTSGTAGLPLSLPTDAIMGVKGGSYLRYGVGRITNLTSITLFYKGRENWKMKLEETRVHSGMGNSPITLSTFLADNSITHGPPSEGFDKVLESDQPIAALRASCKSPVDVG